MKQCNECGGHSLELEAFGTDEYGEYEDYVCNDCGEITRFSVKE